MFDYLMHFTCECSEAGYIDLFNYLCGILENNADGECPASSQWHKTYHIPEPLCCGKCPSNPEKGLLVSRIREFESEKKNVNLHRSIIMLTIDVPFDESKLDIFSYRYLIMIIRQLFRTQDFVALKCDFAHYIKIGSYFILEALNSSQLVAYVSDYDGNSRIVPMPKMVTLSPEWFPAIYLSGQNSEVYEVLNNPLFDGDRAIREALEYHKEGQEKNRLDYRDNFRKSLHDKKVDFRSYFRKCFQIWLNGKLEKFEMDKRLNSVSGMTQLLFAAVYRNLFYDQMLYPNAENNSKLENLLEICCDFSDCILQAAENMVSHSNGGVLSLRINKNWDKIADAFKPVDTSVEKNSRYIRISLVDFSSEGILDTIQHKTEFHGLQLSHVFGTEKTQDDQTCWDYQQFLGKPDHVI